MLFVKMECNDTVVNYKMEIMKTMDAKLCVELYILTFRKSF